MLTLRIDNKGQLQLLQVKNTSTVKWLKQHLKLNVAQIFYKERQLSDSHLLTLLPYLPEIPTLTIQEEDPFYNEFLSPPPTPKFEDSEPNTMKCGLKLLQFFKTAAPRIKQKSKLSFTHLLQEIQKKNLNTTIEMQDDNPNNQTLLNILDTIEPLQSDKILQYEQEQNLLYEAELYRQMKLQELERQKILRREQIARKMVEEKLRKEQEEQRLKDANRLIKLLQKNKEQHRLDLQRRSEIRTSSGEPKHISMETMETLPQTKSGHAHRVIKSKMYSKIQREEKEQRNKSKKVQEEKRLMLSRKISYAQSVKQLFRSKQPQSLQSPSVSTAKNSRIRESNAFQLPPLKQSLQLERKRNDSIVDEGKTQYKAKALLKIIQREDDALEQFLKQIKKKNQMIK